MALVDYGLTPQGFVKMRLPEIREAIVSDLRVRMSAAGVTVVPETRPDSVLGQMIDTFAEREATLWDQLEAVHLSMYPDTSFGVSLDRSVGFTGVVRLRPEPSRVPEIWYGVAGTPVPAGTQIRNAVTQTVYQLESAITISASNAVSVLLTPTVQNSTAYTVTVDATPYTYTSDSSATLAEILAGLLAALAPSGLTLSSSGSQLLAYDPTSTGRSFSLTGPLAFAEIGTYSPAATVENMAETAAIGQVNQTVSLVTGLLRVNNLAPGTAGRALETDAELQARYSEGVFQLGAGTFPSLAPNVRRVTGVTDVVVRKNDSDAVVDGLLPHSVQFIVDGGLSAEVAAGIYRTIGAGIDTNGATAITIDTDEGPQTINFDRPVPEYVWVRVAVTPKSSEADEYPADGPSRVAAGLLALGQAQSSGQDVTWQAFFAPIYEVPGVASADLRFAHSSNPMFVPAFPADYSAANIAISPTQRAVFDASRIQVL